jgi:type I restriction enzyme S subunit
MSENKENTPKIRFPGFTDAWEQRRLGELMEISSASRVHKEEWTETGVPFFRSSDVVSAFKGLENDRAFISYELFEELSNKSGKVQENDLLVTGGGSIGIPYKVRNNEPLYFKDADLIWLKNSSLINSDFLYTFLITPVFRRYVGSITHIGTISHYTIEQAKATPIMMPEIEEQTKIGTFFKHLDHLITLHQRKLNNAKNLKAGLLQKMFPKNGEDFPEVRFPGFTDDWEQRRLGDNAIIKGRLGWKSLKQEEYTQEGPNMIAGKHINDGTIDWTKVDHIPQWRYDESPEIMLENGDVISKEGSLGNPALIENLQGLATINSTMMLVRTDDTINSKFFYHVLRSEQFQRLIFLKVSGSSIPHLFQADMNEFKFWAPSVEEQIKIGEFFSKLDHLITLHQRKLEHLQEQKKALLQQMFI